MCIEDLSYTLWSIVSKVKKTLFGYRVTLIVFVKDTVSVGDTVYVDTDRATPHSCYDDTPARVYRIAVSNFVNHYYKRVKTVELDKAIYNSWNGSEIVWARLWLKTSAEIKEGDIVYASPDMG